MLTLKYPRSHLATRNDWSQDVVLHQYSDDIKSGESRNLLSGNSLVQMVVGHQ